MKSRCLLVVLLGLWSLIGCQPKMAVSPVPPPPTIEKLKSPTKDTQLSLEALQQRDIFGGRDWLSLGRNTAEIFRLSELAMRWGDVCESNTNEDNCREIFRGFGHYLQTEFYKNETAEEFYTTFGPEQTPYVHVALKSNRKLIYSLFRDMIENAQGEIRRLVMPSEMPPLSCRAEENENGSAGQLECRLRNLVGYMRTIDLCETCSNLPEESMMSPMLNDRIKIKIEQDYLPEILRFQDVLLNDLFTTSFRDHGRRSQVTAVQSSRNLRENLITLRGAVSREQFPLLHELDACLVYRVEAQIAYGLESALPQRPDGCSGFSIPDTSSWRYWWDAFWYWNNSASEIHSDISEELDNIWAEIPNKVGQFMLDVLTEDYLPPPEGEEIDVEQARTFRENVVMDVAREELKSRIFSENRLPAVESSQVQAGFFKQDHSLTWYLPPSELDTHGIISNGHTFGQVMSTLSQRLKDMTFEGVPVTSMASRPSVSPVFTHANKMLRSIGHPWEEKSPRPYFRSISSEHQSEMDIYNYGQQPGYYAIPDQFIVENEFDLSLASSEASMHISTESIAEQIRGSALMLRYFHPKSHSHFNNSLSSHTFNEGVFPISIFPKEAFFDMQLGVLSVPLMNLQRAQGLRLIHRHGHHLFGGDVTTEDLDNILMVATHDVSNHCIRVYGQEIEPSEEERCYRSRTHGTARLILALEEALQVLNTVELGMTDELGRLSGDRTNFDRTLEARDMLSDLILGLGLFMTSHVLEENGAVHTFYVFSPTNRNAPDTIKAQGRASGQFDLHTQVASIRAWLKAYQLKKTGFFKSAAIGGYHFLNSHFFDEDIGFYARDLNTEEENSAAQTSRAPDLITQLEVLLMLRELKEVLPELDQAQVNVLIHLWSDQVQEAFAEIQNPQAGSPFPAL